MARALAKKVETSTTLLEAAKKVLRQNGHSGLSTRDVAAAAGVPLSQIHYHFGSKQGLMLALFDYLNAQLLDRQNAMFHDTTLSLSQRWDRACDYLDEDIASGYVRVLQELIAASWSDPEVAKVVRAGLMGWFDLIAGVARQAEKRVGAGTVLGRGGRRFGERCFHRRRKPVPARAGKEGGAGAPVAAARRRCHPHGRGQIIEEVMHARQAARPGGVRRTQRQPHPLRDLWRWSGHHGVPAALEHRPFSHLQDADSLFQRTFPLHHLRRAGQRPVRPARRHRRPTRWTIALPMRSP